MNLNSSLHALVATAVVLAGAASQTPTVRADDTTVHRCSNWTLRGDYGFNVGGTIFAGPETLLLRGVAMTHFDGHGKLDQVDFATIDGVPYGDDWRPGSGTYEINSDCTGSALIVPEGGAPPLPLRLVVVDNGRQVFTIVEGNATGSWGIKVR